MAVTAIVINFNAGNALKACIQALMSGSVKPVIMLVDNASTDGSAAQLRGLYSNQAGLEIIDNPSNIGFARAVNACIENINSSYILIINPDCFIHHDGLDRLLTALNNDDRAALAAPYIANKTGKYEKASLRRFPDPWNSLMTLSGLWHLGRWIPVFQGVTVNPGSLPVETCQAEAVSGACMLIRHSALLEVGLLDEAYGLHCEDLDLMYRLRQGGWHCLFVPSASAVHEQGVSSKSRPLWVHRQKHHGMSRFFSKFQATNHWLPVRWLVYTAIWIRFILLWPVVWLRK
ncbi:MAG: GT2 family glycosyltransferase [Lysobacterales bacterium]|jgi:GT2 family glycosyltransferase